nr:hypothetical protein CFP56_23871 [Quercus suber]
MYSALAYLCTVPVKSSELDRRDRRRMCCQSQINIELSNERRYGSTREMSPTASNPFTKSTGHTVVKLSTCFKRWRLTAQDTGTSSDIREHDPSRHLRRPDVPGWMAVERKKGIVQMEQYYAVVPGLLRSSTPSHPPIVPDGTANRIQPTPTTDWTGGRRYVLYSTLAMSCMDSPGPSACRRTSHPSSPTSSTPTVPPPHLWLETRASLTLRGHVFCPMSETHYLSPDPGRSSFVCGREMCLGDLSWTVLYMLPWVRAQTEPPSFAIHIPPPQYFYLGPLLPLPAV